MVPPANWRPLTLADDTSRSFDSPILIALYGRRPRTHARSRHSRRSAEADRGISRRGPYRVREEAQEVLRMFAFRDIGERGLAGRHLAVNVEQRRTPPESMQTPHDANVNLTSVVTRTRSSQHFCR